MLKTFVIIFYLIKLDYWAITVLYAIQNTAAAPMDKRHAATLRTVTKASSPTGSCASSISAATTGFATIGAFIGIMGWVCCIFTVAFGKTGF